jgi:hypothetical protein
MVENTTRVGAVMKMSFCRLSWGNPGGHAGVAILIDRSGEGVERVVDDDR